MRIANKNDIDEIAQIRIKQQQDDWKNDYDNKNDLLNTTKIYLEKHLNSDFFCFIEEMNNNIIATCCLQVIELLPQCNDNGKQGIYTEPIDELILKLNKIY